MLPARCGMTIALASSLQVWVTCMRSNPQPQSAFQQAALTEASDLPKTKQIKQQK